MQSFSYQNVVCAIGTEADNILKAISKKENLNKAKKAMLYK